MNKAIIILLILFTSCITAERVVYVSNISDSIDKCKYCGHEYHLGDYQYSDGCNTTTCNGKGWTTTTLLYCGDLNIFEAE